MQNAKCRMGLRQHGAASFFSDDEIQLNIFSLDAVILAIRLLVIKDNLLCCFFAMRCIATYGLVRLLDSVDSVDSTDSPDSSDSSDSPSRYLIVKQRQQRNTKNIFDLDFSDETGLNQLSVLRQMKQKGLMRHLGQAGQNVVNVFQEYDRCAIV